MLLDLPEQARILGLRKITLEEYIKLTEEGFFARDERFELLDGYIVRRPTHSPQHLFMSKRCGRRVEPLLPPGWELNYRAEMTLTDSAPEPDLSIVRDRDKEYNTRYPNVGDMGILIEITDERLLEARRDKVRIYAAGSVPEYWIVNIPDRQVEVYTAPQSAAAPPSYATRTDYGIGDAVPLILDGVRIADIPVVDLLQ